MLRLKEIKLPLEHSEEDLRKAILKKLKLTEEELTEFSIYKRSYDARKKGNITLVYIVDVTTPKEKTILKRQRRIPISRPHQRWSITMWDKQLKR